MSCSSGDSKVKKVYTYDTTQFRIFYKILSTDPKENLANRRNHDSKLELSPDELEMIERNMDSALVVATRIGEERYNTWRKKHKTDYLSVKLVRLTKSEYRRQYVVSLNDEGNKIVWVNCFPNKDYLMDSWEDYPVDVLDGGYEYFSFEVNLSTNKQSKLYVDHSLLF